jgi:NAD-dependent deacetylase
MQPPLDDATRRVRDRVQDAHRITVLTGAGVSTDSGIPDYRGPNGVWTKDPAAQRLSSFADYVRDPQVRRAAWAQRSRHPTWSARPNAAHRAFVDLERSGRLVALLTQNVDGLHQLAGSSPRLVVELHGTMRAVQCLGCGVRTPMREELARVAAGDPDPPCRACGGILKSATISFGQALREDVLAAAVSAARACTLFLAAGTSLSVYPAAGLCELATRGGARLVIVNAEPTPYDRLAEGSGGGVLRGPVGEIIPALLAGQSSAPTTGEAGTAVSAAE